MGFWRRSKAESPLATKEQIERVAAHAGYLWGRVHKAWAQAPEGAKDAIRHGVIPGFAVVSDGLEAAFLPERQLLRPVRDRVEVSIYYDFDGNVVVGNRGFRKGNLFQENDTYERVTYATTLAPEAKTRTIVEEGNFHDGGEFAAAPVDPAEYYSKRGLTVEQLTNVSHGLGRIASAPLQVIEGGLHGRPDIPPAGGLYGSRRDIA